ncbi:MAG: hypothetical protein ACO1N0_09765 [Fluviicola sp.]
MHNGKTKTREIKKPGKIDKTNGFVKEQLIANIIVLFLFLMKSSSDLMSMYPSVPLNLIGILRVTLNDFSGELIPLSRIFGSGSETSSMFQFLWNESYVFLTNERL